MQCCWRGFSHSSAGFASRIFGGIGKRKDYKLKLHIDCQVTPIAQKLNRVPFALREKVTANLEELIYSCAGRWADLW